MDAQKIRKFNQNMFLLFKVMPFAKQRDSQEYVSLFIRLINRKPNLIRDNIIKGADTLNIVTEILWKRGFSFQLNDS